MRAASSRGPDVPNEQADLIKRKGDEHERAYLETLRAQFGDVREIEFEPGGWDEAQARDAAGDARRRRRRLPGRVLGWRLARVRRLPAPRREAVRARRLELRGARHEARALGEAGVHPPAALLQRAARAAAGTRAGRDPRAARLRRAGVVPAGGVRRLLPARPRAARALRRRPAADRAAAGRPLRDLRLQAALRRALGRGRSPLARRRALPDADREARGGRDHDARRARRARRASRCRRGSAPTRGRSCASRPSSSSGRASTGRTRFVLLQPQPESGFSLLPDPSPGDLFFDFEGNPFWDKDGSLEYLWGILDVERNFTPLHAHDHATERQAFETFVDLVHERLERFPDLHVYHYAQYEITALRRLMGRYGTREAELDDLLRRGVFVDLYRVVRNAIRASRPGYGLKELEAFLDFDAAGRDAGRRHVDHRLRAVDADARPGAARPDRRVQPRGLHRDAAPARLAARAARGGARARSGRSRCPSRRSRSRSRTRRPRARSSASALLDAGEELAAQLLDYHDRERKPVWWAFFDRIEMTPAELVEDSDSIGRLELVGEPVQVEALARVHAHASRRRSTRSARGRARSTRRRARGRARSSSSTARRGGSCSSAARRFEEVPLPEALIPGRPVRHRRSGGRARAARPVAARRRRALPGARVDPPPRAVRPADADVGPRGDEGARALARRAAPRHPGAAGLGEDVDVGTADRAPDRPRQARRASPRRATRRSTTCSTRSRTRPPSPGSSSRGLKKASGGNPGVAVRELAHRERRGRVGVHRLRPRRPAPPGSSRGPSTTRRSTTSSSTRPGRSRSPTRSRWATAARNIVLVGDPQQLDQVIQGTHPAG